MVDTTRYWPWLIMITDEMQSTDRLISIYRFIKKGMRGNNSANYLPSVDSRESLSTVMASSSLCYPTVDK